MATNSKKKLTESKKPKTARGAKTAEKIVGLAESVVTYAAKKKDPAIDIPLRTLSNANYNKHKRIIEMGNKAQTRNFFNLGMAKSYMQTILIASGCKKLIDEDKTTSIRGLYYLSKHTIAGTNQKTFYYHN